MKQKNRIRLDQNRLEQNRIIKFSLSLHSPQILCLGQSELAPCLGENNDGLPVSFLLFDKKSAELIEFKMPMEQGQRKVRPRRSWLARGWSRTGSGRLDSKLSASCSLLHAFHGRLLRGQCVFPSLSHRFSLYSVAQVEQARVPIEHSGHRSAEQYRTYPRSHSKLRAGPRLS